MWTCAICKRLHDWPWASTPAIKEANRNDWWDPSCLIQNYAQRNRPRMTVFICGLWWNPAFCPRHCLRQKIPTCGKCDFPHRKYGCWTIQPTCWHVTTASAQFWSFFSVLCLREIQLELTLQTMHGTKQMNCVHLQSAQIECLQQHVFWHSEAYTCNCCFQVEGWPPI